MRNMKSQDPNDEISHYYGLLSSLYSDVARAYPARYSTECRRDLITIKKRLHSEGLAFLTKTLPSLGKAIDKALSSDTTLQVPSFARKKGSKLPNFLGWLIGFVFSPDGTALPAMESAVLALRHARQLLFLVYKLELPYDQATVDKTIATFKSNDQGLQRPWELNKEQVSMLHVARSALHRVLCNADPRNIIPKHGPGAVAGGQTPWEKIDFSVFYPGLDAIYSYSDHMVFSLSHLCDEVGPSGFCSLETREEATAKVVLVPKDSRGPRLISMEPVEMMWIQQGLKTLLYETTESHRLTSKHVNFEDQSINRRLALESSKDGSKVTLDMKDASDLVSLQLVHTLFPINWVECMESCRSTGTLCPDGDRVELNKFASMGSALCFPVEALVFWALSCSALVIDRGFSLEQAARRVWVFGDDIILHREDYPVVMQLMEVVGLKFNSAKCCTGAHFRESCGMDAYNGSSVTPIRLKRRWSSSLRCIQTYSSYVDYTNRFREGGYTATADFLEKEIQMKRRTPYTMGAPSGIMFVAEPYQDIVQLNRQAGVTLRFSKKLHRMEVKTWAIRPVQRNSSTGWRELLARTSSNGFLARRETETPSFRKGIIVTADLLDRRYGSTQSMVAGCYSVPHRVSSKCGWAQVFNKT